LGRVAELGSLDKVMRATLSIFVFTSFLISVSATESVKVDVTNQSVTVNGITPGSNGGILI